jgi:hypothetical protein
MRRLTAFPPDRSAEIPIDHCFPSEVERLIKPLLSLPRRLPLCWEAALAKTRGCIAATFRCQSFPERRFTHRSFASVRISGSPPDVAVILSPECSFRGTDQVRSFLIWYRDIGNHEVEALPLRNRSYLQAIPSRQHLMASFFQDFRQQSAHARQQEQRDRRAPTNRRRYRITGRFLERCRQLQPVGDFTSSWDGSSKTNFRVPGNPFPVQPVPFQ